MPHGFKKEEVYQVLRNTTLPPSLNGLNRIIKEDYIIFKMIHSFSDIEEWTKISNTLQVWLKQTFNLPVFESFNELDDEQVTLNMGLEKNKYLTLYHDQFSQGFQSFLVDSNNKAENTKKWNNLQKWSAAQKLPNGKALKEVIIIVPSREDALRIRQAANDSGFEKIYYIGSNNEFWNPFYFEQSTEKWFLE